MKPHRLTGFATSAKNDPYQLDADGFPKDQTTLDAIEFMEQSKAKPFSTMQPGLCIPPYIAGARNCWKNTVKKLGWISQPIQKGGLWGTKKSILLCDGGNV